MTGGADVTALVPEGLDVRPAQWRTVRDILGEHLPEHEVWAFGSRVTGAARPYSDLDLVIIADEPISLAMFGTLREAFSDSDLPWKVDLADWASLDPALREVIRRQHVRLPLPAVPVQTTA